MCICVTSIPDKYLLLEFHLPFTQGVELCLHFFSVPELDMVDYVSGILMMQDIQLGTLMALLPFFEGGAFSKYHTHHPTIALWVLQLVQVLFGFPLLVLIFRLLAARIVEKFHRFVHNFTWLHLGGGGGRRHSPSIGELLPPPGMSP